MTNNFKTIYNDTEEEFEIPKEHADILDKLAEIYDVSVERVLGHLVLEYLSTIEEAERFMDEYIANQSSTDPSLLN